MILQFSFTPPRSPPPYHPARKRQDKALPFSLLVCIFLPIPPSSRPLFGRMGRLGKKSIDLLNMCVTQKKLINFRLFWFSTFFEYTIYLINFSSPIWHHNLFQIYFCQETEAKRSTSFAQLHVRPEYMCNPKRPPWLMDCATASALCITPFVFIDNPFGTPPAIEYLVINTFIHFTFRPFRKYKQ